MSVCPNCNHQNPDGAVQCEACYTPLPAMTTCPNCGASVQVDASFCGQCGFNLQASIEADPTQALTAAGVPEMASSYSSSANALEIPDLLPAEPLIQPEPLLPEPIAASPATSASGSRDNHEAVAPPAAAAPSLPGSNPPAIAPPPPSVPPQLPVANSPTPSLNRTQLQTQTARLLHVQTNNSIELPPTIPLIHIGKPNDRIPPDVDVSGFPNSEIVSRVHADIRVEGDAFFIEDVGSSNGTYINNVPLPPGNRHRLRPGDRIALGKGDKVSFLFQMS